MVLRYKALVAFALAIFVLVWWNGVEFFPLSSIPMYTKPALSSTVLYFRVLDAEGNVVNDNAAFFVASIAQGMKSQQEPALAAAPMRVTITSA